jgi:DNA-directed RNA polymerase specialized sigma24 family protein
MMCSRGGERLAVVDIRDILLQQVALHEFLTSLPMYLQRVAGLYRDGYSYAEIAEQLNVQVGTVKRYMARIRLLGQAFFGKSDNQSADCVVNNNI